MSTVAVLALLASLLLTSAGAQDAAPAPGTRGTVLTALEGTTIEEIPLTFVGTLDNALGPGYDLYLVRLEGPVAERVGVAAGMSGSPVYVEDELIGALAYRIGVLPKDAIGGVTPFHDIRDASATSARAAAATDSLARPIVTPVQIGGLTGAVREWITPRLRELGFEPVMGSSGAVEGSGQGNLQPGSPVGVELVRGDMGIAATGTVTAVQGDRVWAFGHSFFGSGRVELPMIAAEVVHTLADMAGSVKFARYGNEVGAITDDRLSAVVGRTGQRVSMIPVDLVVRGADYGEREFHFELARHPQLAPLLAGAVVSNALLRDLGHNDEATLLVNGRIVLEGLPDLPLELAFSGEGATDPAFAVSAAVRRALNDLWVNRFAEVDVKAVELSITARAEMLRYRVGSLHYDRGPLRPGQTLEVDCVLERRRGERRTERISIPIPGDLSGDRTVALAVGPPEQIDRALGRPLRERLNSAQNLDALVAALAERRSAHRLTAVLFQSDGGVVSRGEAYTGLPPTAQRLLSARSGASRGKPTRVAELARSELALDGPVEGGLMVRLRVDADLETKERD